MDIKQKTEMLTTLYIHSYNFALKEVKNPNLAAQIATSVIMVMEMNTTKQQTVNPLELLFAQMAAQQPEPGEKEGGNHDRAENEAD